MLSVLRNRRPVQSGLGALAIVLAMLLPSAPAAAACVTPPCPVPSGCCCPWPCPVLDGSHLGNLQKSITEVQKKIEQAKKIFSGFQKLRETIESAMNIGNIADLVPAIASMAEAGEQIAQDIQALRGDSTPGRDASQFDLAPLAGIPTALQGSGQAAIAEAQLQMAQVMSATDRRAPALETQIERDRREAVKEQALARFSATRAWAHARQVQAQLAELETAYQGIEDQVRAAQSERDNWKANTQVRLAIGEMLRLYQEVLASRIELKSSLSMPQTPELDLGDPEEAAIFNRAFSMDEPRNQPGSSLPPPAKMTTPEMEVMSSRAAANDVLEDAIAFHNAMVMGEEVSRMVPPSKYSIDAHTAALGAWTRTVQTLSFQDSRVNRSWTVLPFLDLYYQNPNATFEALAERARALDTTQWIEAYRKDSAAWQAGQRLRQEIDANSPAFGAMKWPWPPEQFLTVLEQPECFRWEGTQPEPPPGARPDDPNWVMDVTLASCAYPDPPLPDVALFFPNWLDVDKKERWTRTNHTGGCIYFDDSTNNICLHSTAVPQSMLAGWGGPSPAPGAVDLRGGLAALIRDGRVDGLSNLPDDPALLAQPTPVEVDKVVAYPDLGEVPVPNVPGVYDFEANEVKALCAALPRPTDTVPCTQQTETITPSLGGTLRIEKIRAQLDLLSRQAFAGRDYERLALAQERQDLHNRMLEGEIRIREILVDTEMEPEEKAEEMRRIAPQVRDVIDELEAKEQEIISYDIQADRAGPEDIAACGMTAAEIADLETEKAGLRDWQAVLVREWDARDLARANDGVGDENRSAEAIAADLLGRYAPAGELAYLSVGEDEGLPAPSTRERSWYYPDCARDPEFLLAMASTPDLQQIVASGQGLPEPMPDASYIPVLRVVVTSAPSQGAFDLAYWAYVDAQVRQRRIARAEQSVALARTQALLSNELRTYRDCRFPYATLDMMRRFHNTDDRHVRPQVEGQPPSGPTWADEALRLTDEQCQPVLTEMWRQLHPRPSAVTDIAFQLTTPDGDPFEAEIEAYELAQQASYLVTRKMALPPHYLHTGLGDNVGMQGCDPGQFYEDPEELLMFDTDRGVVSPYDTADFSDRTCEPGGDAMLFTQYMRAAGMLQSDTQIPFTRIDLSQTVEDWEAEREERRARYAEMYDQWVQAEADMFQ